MYCIHFYFLTALVQSLIDFFIAFIIDLTPSFSSKYLSMPFKGRNSTFLSFVTKSREFTTPSRSIRMSTILSPFLPFPSCYRVELWSMLPPLGSRTSKLASTLVPFPKISTAPRSSLTVIDEGNSKRGSCLCRVRLGLALNSGLKNAHYDNWEMSLWVNTC